MENSSASERARGHRRRNGTGPSRRVALALLCLAGLAAQAREQMQPAGFMHEDAKKRLATRIEFPEVKGNATAMIHCFTQVSKSGKMESTGCYAQDNFESAFAAAIMKAAKRSSMTPAIIEGKKQKVYVQFRVEFIAEGEDRKIYIYSNPANAENIEAYGYEHIAAQRAIGKEGWQEVCPQRAMYLVIAKAFVGEDGRASHVTLEHLNGIRPTLDCQNAIRASILESPFTPALADGQPVPSTYVESYGN